PSGGPAEVMDYLHVHVAPFEAARSKRLPVEDEIAKSAPSALFEERRLVERVLIRDRVRGAGRDLHCIVLVRPGIRDSGIPAVRRWSVHGGRSPIAYPGCDLELH